MTARPPTTLSLIGTAWAFYRKQSVFQSILLWMLIVPLSVTDLLTALFEPANATLALAFALSVGVLQTFIVYWGQAAILLVGHRMIRNRAGRARTSLVPVLQESASLVLPLLGTSLLRTCTLVYRALLFVLPALAFTLSPALCHADRGSAVALLTHRLIGCQSVLLLAPLLLPTLIHYIRTSLAQAAFAADDLRFREALRRSVLLTRGRFCNLCGTLLVCAAILIVPALLFSIGLDSAIGALADQRLEPVSIVLTHAAFRFSFLLFTLSLIAYYGRLTDKKKGPVEVKR